MLIYLNIENNTVTINNDMYPDADILSVNKYIENNGQIKIELAFNTSNLEQEVLKKFNIGNTNDANNNQ
jgi:hypothetical protein